MPHAIIVDADQVAARTLGWLVTELELHPIIVHSQADAVAALRQGDVALVAVEMSLPDTDGVEVALALRARRYRGPLVFVSRRTELQDLLRGYSAGADDYLVKPYEPALLVAKLRALVRRCAGADAQPLGERLRVDDAALELGTLTYHSAVVDSVTLDATETRLLECLMRNPAIVIGRETLLQRVWGYDVESDCNRVDVYISRLRRKLEVDPTQPTYLHTVRGLGYTFRPTAARSAAATKPLSLPSVGARAAA